MRSAILVVMLPLALSALGCGNARPYRAMAKAATSEENVFAQAQDKRLGMQIREAVVAVDPSQALSITPHAYMGHVYLTGFVTSPGQAEDLMNRVRAIDGVRTVDGYLPRKPVSRSIAADEGLKAKMKAALAVEPGEVVTRVTIEVLAGHVVLLGVVASQQAIDDAGRLAANLDGVTGVTNFLILPESEYESRRPHLR
jgi:hyperosmotically inducible periplasmic protein